MPSALALDIGTSSVRAALCDAAGRLVEGAVHAEAHAPETTADGGAELDADALVDSAVRCAREALARARGARPEVVGVCTFWHSVLGVDAAGRAVTPVSLWSDTRSQPQVERLRRELDERAIHARTGCRFHTSYLPARLLWMAENRRAQFTTARQWMSPGEYLFQRLFGQAECSVSMASGTGLFNHATADWDEEVLAHLPIDREQLSPIAADASLARGLAPEFAAELPALAGARWLPALGDGACSNVGSGCISEDRMAVMIGTSGAMRVFTGDPGSRVPFGLWHYRLDRRRHLVGGALSNGGGLVAWLRQTLQLGELEELEKAVAAVPPDGHGLTALPFLAGERCPNWRGDARAAVTGLSQHTTPAEIARAGLEAVAYRFAAVHDLLAPLAAPGYRLTGSGGALLASPTWSQILADVLARPITLTHVPEATSRGAALAALEAAGLIGSLDEADPPFEPPVVPRPDAVAIYAEGRERHERLYQRLIAEGW